MKGLTISKNGNRRLLIFCDDLSEFPQQLHDAAMNDPALEKAIMTTATAISYSNKSKLVGEQMIDMISGIRKF